MPASTVSYLAKKIAATVISGTIVVAGGGLVLASVSDQEPEPEPTDNIVTLQDVLDAKEGAGNSQDNHGTAVSTAAKECAGPNDDTGVVGEVGEVDGEYANKGECVRETARSPEGKPDNAKGPGDAPGQVDKPDAATAGQDKAAGNGKGNGKP